MCYLVLDNFQRRAKKIRLRYYDSNWKVLAEWPFKNPNPTVYPEWPSAPSIPVRANLGDATLVLEKFQGGSLAQGLWEYQPLFISR
jgi:hypothetical protein